MCQSMVNIQSPTAEIRRGKKRKKKKKKEERNRMKLECGPMPNVMVALWNRETIYIFILFLLLFFARLISAVGDWMSTILRHMVWS